MRQKRRETASGVERCEFAGSGLGLGRFRPLLDPNLARFACLSAVFHVKHLRELVDRAGLPVGNLKTR